MEGGVLGLGGIAKVKGVGDVWEYILVTCKLTKIVGGSGWVSKECGDGGECEGGIMECHCQV